MPATDGFNPENPYGSASTVVAAPGPAPSVDGVVQQADTTVVEFDANAVPNTPAPVAPVAPVAPAAPVDGQTPAPVTPTAPVAPVEGAPAIPAGGFDKFYNAESGAYNWEAHAREADFRVAQKGKGSGVRPAPQPQPAAGDTAAKDAVADAGLNWDSLAETIQVNGKLDQSQYDALAQAGIPTEIVDGYIEALGNVGSLSADAALRYVGGTNDGPTNQATMDDLMNWAFNNLTEAEITQHDALLASPNWRISIDALQTARGAQPQPQPQPVPLTGGNAVAADTGAGGFKDFNEQIAAQRDPRYSTDENFRAEVIRRIGLGA